MSAIKDYIFSLVVLIPMGVSATFFVLLNAIKQEEKRKERNDGKTNKQDLL
jgi:hypothetical protein